MSARHLLLGLDGADLDLILALGSAQLPTLHGLMARGMFAACQSVLPPATLPNWTTLLTGANPGVHGVFDFTTRRGYQVRFTAGTVRQVPTIMSTLDAQGRACACIGFPATWPPERLAHGVFISGWDAPVAFESDASFVWPTELYQDIVQRFGPQRFDDVDELHADAPGWHARLPDALCDRIARKVELGRWLLEDKRWDVFALYFGESDTAAHHLWAEHDARSPRHPKHPSAGDGLRQVYAALDRAVASLIEAAGGDGVEVTIVSDHGSGGSSDKVLYLNRVLANAGWLRFRDASLPSRATSTAKNIALRGLPPSLRERVFRWAGASLPGWLESQARFGAIDMRQTRAFSDELNYFPAIHWNVRGREPDGQLDPEELPAATECLSRDLLALRDPWSGAPVVAAVHPRQALFEGPYVDRAPDLLLELHMDDGYSYNLMPSPMPSPVGSAPFRRLHAHEHAGRKGRSLAGSHRPQGLFIAAGPRIAPVGRVQAHIADVTATLLQRVQEPGAAALSGVVHAPRAPLATEHEPHRHELGDEARIERRLRALGYVE